MFNLTKQNRKQNKKEQTNPKQQPKKGGKMVKKIIVILLWNPYSITINISNNPLPVSVQTGGSMHLRQLIKKGSGQSHAFFFW